MREGWKEATLGDVAELIMGQSPPGESYNERGEGLPFIQGSAEFGVHHPRPKKWCNDPRKVAEPGDVLLSVRAPVGDTNTADRRIAIGRGLVLVRGVDGLTTAPFLRLLLESGTDRLLARSGGGMFTSITGSALRTLPVDLPALPEQRRIVDLVATLDDVVAAASLAPARRAYDSVLAAMASEPGGLQLSDALRPGGVARVVEPDEEYRILGVLRSGEGFIERGQIRGRGTGYKKLFRVGADELVYRKLTAWEGPISVSTEAESGGWVSPEFPIFKIDDAVLLPGLMRHFCRWPGFWRKIEDRLVGSVQRRKRLNPDALLGIELPMPSLEVQASWLDALDSMWASVGARSATVSALQRTRAHLLAALMSGEHGIPESYDELLGVAS